MEEMIELLKRMQEELRDKDDIEQAKEKAKEVVDNAKKCILVSTDCGVGYAGNAIDVMSALLQLILKVLTKTKEIQDDDKIREMTEFIITLYKLDEDEQDRRLEERARQPYENIKKKMEDDKTSEIKSKLEEMKSRTKSEEIKNRIDEIDKLLKEME